MTTPSAPHDLRTFFRSVGRFSGEKALTSTPIERPEPDVPVELLDFDNARIEGPRLPVSAFVDGVQSSIVVTYRSHRPVYLSYAAAAAVGPRARALDVRERLNVVCSTLDREWVDSLASTIPIEELPIEIPFEIERAAVQSLGGNREALERHLVEDLCTQVPDHLVVDGSLTARPYEKRLVGVVKSSNRKYLADESFLFRLPAGWRSPRFKIPAGSAGSGYDRYSCYLRMFDASQRSWNFALVRLETYDPDILDQLAALCLAERQSPSGGDPRFDRHLASVRATEELLRSRRPSVYNL